MKKQLIAEAFRFQQLAGIKPVNSLKEDKGTHYAKALQRYLNYHCND
jgi:hypothetical protein